MPKPITVSIDTLSHEDVADLLQDLCENLLGLTMTDAKRKHLGFFGKDSVVDTRKITVDDVLKIALKAGATINVSVTYESSIITKEELEDMEEEVAPDPYSTMQRTNTDIAMEEQKRDITNHAFKQFVDGIIVSAVNVPEPKKPGIIPAIVIPPFET
jgi:hypothetical protein